MYHSTETALLKITNDILMNQNEQRSTALVAIDLSAVFDLVNHSNLIKRDYIHIMESVVRYWSGSDPTYLVVCRV